MFVACSIINGNNYYFMPRICREASAPTPYRTWESILVANEQEKTKTSSCNPGSKYGDCSNKRIRGV